jgi:predicted HTH domain antitoxin
MSVLHVPDDVLKRLGLTDRDALVEIACRLYETQRLRLDEAARLANIDLDTFADACASRKIAVYWYRAEDLESDLETLKKMSL